MTCKGIFRRPYPILELESSWKVEIKSQKKKRTVGENVRMILIYIYILEENFI